jgi:ankyrin repeat protein
MEHFIQAYEACKQNEVISKENLSEDSIKTLVEYCEKNNKDVSLNSLNPQPSNKTLKDILGQDLLMSCLEKACSWNDLEHVQYLIKQGTSINIEEKPTYFFKAIENGNMLQLKYLVEAQKLDINAWDGHALYMAARTGRLDVVKYLVEQGADIRAKDYCALRCAAMNNNFKVMKYLMENLK